MHLCQLVDYDRATADFPMFAIMEDVVQKSMYGGALEHDAPLARGWLAENSRDQNE